MKLIDINPYVRFARKQTKSITCKPVIALDNRAFYCLDGEMRIKVANTEYTIKKGSFIMWQAGIPYCNLSANTGTVLLGCNFDYIYSDSNPKLPVSYIGKEKFHKAMLVENNLSDNSILIPDCLYLQFAPFEDTFSEIIKEYTEKELYYEERCNSLMKDIIISACRLAASNENHNRKSKADLILAYIRENYNKNLTNDAIAQHFSYHPNYISNLIKKRTGISLHKYLLQYRIHMAIMYLQSGKYNVTETASLVGFSDIKHFSKCFSMITGASPSSYRINEF